LAKFWLLSGQFLDLFWNDIKEIDMSTQETTQTPSAPKSPVSAGSRRSKKAEGRKKRTLKLRSDKEFAKQYFESKSKRSVEKKSAFRKKKSKKK
jgi:hypothetical protein